MPYSYDFIARGMQEARLRIDNKKSEAVIESLGVISIDLAENDLNNNSESVQSESE